MSASTISLRFFELTEEIANPQKDLRSGQRWTRQATLYKGMRFIERIETGYSNVREEAWTDGRLYWVNSGRDYLSKRTGFYAHEPGELWQAMLPYLKEVEPTAEEWIEGFTGFNRIITQNVLVKLMEQFKVSRRDIEQAYAAYHDDDPTGFGKNEG